MKNLVSILLLGLISLTMNAQKIIEKNIDYKNQFIDVEVKFASLIEVKTWDKSTVYFKVDLTTEDGKFQDMYELDIDEGSSTIYIESKAEPVFKAFHEEWNKNNPDKKKRYYNTGDMYEFNYVIYIPKNARFKISSINGDLKSEVIEGEFEADLINGDIDIAKYSGELDLSTINGEIDLKMTNVKMVAETIHGDIYADDKLKFSSTDRHVGQKISGSLGNASNRLKLNTINGNMYLRL
ncbi:hypothetical protein FEE95_04370 [Maribacter algarum]|uniref:Adhesin domain-containing protein n=1 Tax=Maribacter algarum (ex Zhang et al. 2020) TaxID=2578118 RepID=A0A5S3PUP9_9FLAO|nr:DUF4097 family beta strand repeat-containing protein [Maribacter algarum]TMM58670.1 hypothetical protein FEE95_04370 [Maribacter algarum]